MIRLKPNPTFRFKVALGLPGSEERATFTLVGRHKGAKALQEWAGRAREAEGQDHKFLAEAIDGWDDVLDADGAPVPYSADALAALLDAYPGSGLEIFRAYVAELSAARGKN